MNRLISVIGENENTEQETHFSKAGNRHMKENRKYLGSDEILEIQMFLESGGDSACCRIFSLSVSRNPKYLSLRINIFVVS